MISELEEEMDSDDGPSLWDGNQRRGLFTAAIAGDMWTSSLAVKYGGALDEAVKQHADDPTNYGYKRRTTGKGRTAPAKDGPGDTSDFLIQTRSLGKLLFHIASPKVLEQLLTDAGAPDALDWELRQLLEELGQDYLDRADSEQGFLVSKDRGRPVKPKSVKLGLQTTRLCEVSEEPTVWLWPQRIPLDNLALINGDPGLGKTWAVLDMAARITTGRGFPDGSPNPFISSSTARRNVLWVTAEESTKTIRNRFRILQGDASRFEVVDNVVARVAGKKGQTEDRVQSLNLSDHMEYLDKYLTDHPLVAVIVLDPISAFLGKVDAHRNNEVRAVLSPVKKLAEKHQVAIIGINHLNKDGKSANAIYRLTGSIAFIGAARASWMVTPDPKDKDRRLFTEIKVNDKDKEVKGLAFRVGPSVTGAFHWEEGAVESTANEALAALQSDERETSAPARAKAKEWLRNVLKDGQPVLAAKIKEQAEADKLCWGTVWAAKEELGVIPKKTGGKGTPWTWKLP